MREVRLARLAILLTFLSACHIGAHRSSAKQRGHIDALLQLHLVTLPDKMNQDDTKNPVNGPVSASGVDKTEDMEVLDSSAGILPSEEAKKNISNTVLTDDGNADEVQRRSGELAYWPNFKDFFTPQCRNCKAVLNYKWILKEYAGVYGIKPLLIFAMFAFIWLLGTTARDFFVPPLLYWAEWLQLPPEMAGATLLAFGNSAPDILTVVTAAQKDDFPLAVSEMLGSNMFGLCITGSLVALTSWYARRTTEESSGMAAEEAGPDHDKVSDKSLAVTVVFYFLTMLVMAFILLQEHPSVIKTLFVPMVYILYVTMLWWFRDQKEKPESLAAPEENQASEDPLVSGEGGTGDALSQADTPLPLEGVVMPKDAAPLDVAFWWVSLPAYILRHACIPSIDCYWGPLRRKTSAFAPLGMVTFCLIANVGWMQDMSIIALMGFVLLGFVCGLSIYLGSNNERTLPWFYPILALFALVASIIWLSVLASEITALVEAIGFTLDVPRLRLGYTAVAWGNCLTDMLVCLATVQKGHTAMAVTAIFAAPLIDDLIAFGASLIMVSWERHHIPVLCGANCPREFKYPLITSLSFIAVAVVLLSCALREKGSRVKIWAGMLAGLYVVFLILVVFVEKVDAPIKAKNAATSL